MGVFPTNCQICNKSFMWFSGLPAQVCATCYAKPNKASDEDVDDFMEEHSDLMDMLAKQEEIDKMEIRLAELKTAHNLIGRLIKELEDEIEKA